MEQAREACLAAERKLARTVVAARAVSASWADIGRAAGMTRQAAHERWDKTAKQELSPERSEDTLSP
ncbi:hypothetical protein [Arthrobacter methylotrophus]|uniref:hypothetical protein n=1 Tax=Arthrobacter methylotrophus TaxID=121291 RepID=UPI0031E70EC9